MKKILVRVPMRADLAGGTLDLWPLYLFQKDACTINVAISYHAECEVTTIDDDQAIEVALLDLDYRQRYESLQELAKDPKVALACRVLEHFRLSGVRVVTRSDAPRGSGLGASSALAVALVRAISEITGEPLDGEDLIPLVRDLETRLIGVPAGVQDYYPPIYGGLATLRLEPGRIVRQQLSLPLGELGRHLVVHYSGISHFSGTNNWEIYKRFMDGDETVKSGLSRIAGIANEMEDALEAHDLRECGKLLAEEWKVRKELFGGISNPQIDRIVRTAKRAGAWGAKVCGAGGGGSIVFFVDPDRRQKVLDALEGAAGFTVPATPVPYGLETFTPDDSLTSRKQARWKIRPSGAQETIEELWLAGDGNDALRPYLVTEVAVQFDQSRRGAVYTATRHFVVPIRTDNERVEWSLLRTFDDDGIKLAGAPSGAAPDARSVETAMRVAAESLLLLADQVAERERLDLLHNPALGLLSAPGESREDFIDRCMEAALEQSGEALHRHESTFRLRMEQVRERYEHDRKLALQEREREGGEHEEQPAPVNWGQIVHDILSGREPTMPDASTPLEVDYLGKVRQHRRQWERDRATLDEETRDRARQIERVEVQPEASNIQIERHFIVWARALESFPDKSS
jgi:D-glycero-alpha-D-manno-heptose-7-phosphate kinase